MTAPIGPGDWVECVRSAGPDYYGNVIERGSIYLVAFLAPFNPLPGNPDGDGLRLSGIGNDECLWVPERFRPVYRPREDLIATLLEPLPDTVLPVEA